MAELPPPIPSETRDWTFILERGCPECSYAPHKPVGTAARLAAANDRWQNALRGSDLDQRPSPQVWSPIEYACHARDMIRLLGDRVEAMLREEDPVFADWDGDATAVRLGYQSASPLEVAADLDRCTRRTMTVLARFPPGDEAVWARTGRRSDGVSFTVAGLCQYLVHDVEHHLHDVRG